MIVEQKYLVSFNIFFLFSRFGFIVNLEIIPINKNVIKDWYEFEGASTYEYAHAEVKASKIASAM